MFEIKPLELVERKTIKKLSVKLHDFELHRFASFHIRFCDENDNIVKSELLRLEGNDYDNWGNDDDYIYKKACEKFGLCYDEPDVEEPVEESVEGPADAEGPDSLGNVVEEPVKKRGRPKK